MAKKTPEIRRMLQKKGTEEGRDKYGEDIWIKTLNCWIELAEMRNEVDVILVGDCRFKNEAEWLSKKGALLVRLYAPDRNEIKLKEESNGCPNMYDKIKNHSSETDMDDFEIDEKRIIDNTISNSDNAKEKMTKLLNLFTNKI